MHLSINGNTMVEKSIETEVALIKKDIHDLKSIDSYAELIVVAKNNSVIVYNWEKDIVILSLAP